jgi:aspartyl-tRNA(Asn)/glutamyl-tRNA(Gln) amidotransferase subunit A
MLRNTWPFNAARTPAISIPCGFGTGGLPIGLQLVAATFDDERLLAAAGSFQARTTWHTRRP